jgi:hypothetical protein
VRSKLVAQGAIRNKVDRAAEEILEEELEVHVPIEGGRAFEVDEEINVAVLSRLVTRRRAEKP